MKKSRAERYSNAEVAVLVEEVSCRPTLFSPFTNAVTSKSKQREWTEVAEKVNSVSHIKRSFRDVRKKWHDLTSRTKQKEAKLRAAMCQKSGVRPSRLTEWEEKVIEVIGKTALKGITKLVGSDSWSPASQGGPPCLPSVCLASNEHPTCSYAEESNSEYSCMSTGNEEVPAASTSHETALTIGASKRIYEVEKERLQVEKERLAVERERQFSDTIEYFNTSSLKKFILASLALT
ncbi:myb-related transcription factor, partner of profilin [Lingula anatina]|uniref:Myb-related transcription factor, partner of profilin n=1 Tax=Lingula anatina TaxID=7574 RepID=A0A1S3K1F0_LINAN|nr:myb-related transcription factor, partner of profilin [Lingula anatina]|eukprot:XP_013416096.1 myb-related transcription factor, partner of profilin [Lingula anatina]